MLTIELVNDGTGNNKSANYRYRVLVNGTEISKGEVTGHDRMNGWERLVFELAKQVERDKWLRGLAEIMKCADIEEAKKIEKEVKSQLEF